MSFGMARVDRLGATLQLPRPSTSSEAGAGLARFTAPRARPDETACCRRQLRMSPAQPLKRPDIATQLLSQAAIALNLCNHWEYSETHLQLESKMKAEITRENGVLLVRPMDRLDRLAAPAFEKLLTENIKDDTMVVIDFESVTYISGAGIRCALKTGEELKRRDGGIALSSMLPEIREVFRRSGLDNMIPIHETVEESVRVLKQ